MTDKPNRDDFKREVVDALAKRAAYHCSNPDCLELTVGPGDSGPASVLYWGVGAHITAAAAGGPRYDASLTPEQRGSAENGIYLCGSCSMMIDKNKGLDFPADTLREWKARHERFVGRSRSLAAYADMVIVGGSHSASGVGEITGLDVRGPAFIQPGTVVTASGFGTVTATRIGGSSEGGR